MAIRKPLIITSTAPRTAFIRPYWRRDASHLFDLEQRLNVKAAVCGHARCICRRFAHSDRYL